MTWTQAFFLGFIFIVWTGLLSATIANQGERIETQLMRIAVDCKEGIHGTDDHEARAGARP